MSATLTRRGLLGMLVAAAIDPERLIWQPGKKLISIPAPRIETWTPIEPIYSIAFSEWADAVDREIIANWEECQRLMRVS